jgi:hypothetical protein
LLEDAQARLADAAMAQGMAAQGAAFSAYINGLLQSARLTAVITLLMQARLLPIEAENFDTVEDYLAHLTVEAINGNIIPRLKAAAAPTIITPGREH